VIVDFWAPVRTLSQFRTDLRGRSEKYSDIVFAKVNTEDEQELAAYFQIRLYSYPDDFSQRVIVYSQPGMLPRQRLEDFDRRAKDLDMDQVRKEIATEEVRLNRVL